ncbi:MAG: peptide chain release factor N(5)-glutamine methyltransferase [Oscillospiraceae bacterium]|nr:peptide chain release factor N(5)-glutamine methyltransferase [Oscillospiraceae bacterium]
MVINSLVRFAEDALTENARYEAEQMVMSALEISHTELVLHGRNRETTDVDFQAVGEMVERRKKGEPLQYILGECEFMSLDFYVESGVLIPRSDTETLVETVINAAAKDKKAEILDICTGSGCIGISLARFLPYAEVDLIDISDKAIEVASKNIIRNDVSDRVKVIKKDILNEYPDKQYDVVVSNPPYIETDVIDTLQATVKDFEPRLALDGGEDGLIFYRRIVSLADKIIRKNGVLAFEIGYNQGEAVKKLMEEKFTDVRVIQDLSGNNRVVIGILK